MYLRQLDGLSDTFAGSVMSTKDVSMFIFGSTTFLGSKL